MVACSNFVSRQIPLWLHQFHPNSRGWRGHVLFIGLTAIGCVWLYGGFLFHTYAGADFPPAVSYALNFQIALDHGQFPPRLVETAREFQLGLGTVDGTPATPDAPVFQYYAFLPSALAYPFLTAGVPGPEAVGCAILLSFLIGSGALYATAIILNASRGAAFVAVWAYLVSPWLISNIYGRGGVAEGISHAILPILLLGVAFAWTGRHRSAIVTIAAGIALLALAHNIFLLYGVFLCAIVCAAGGIVELVVERPRSMAALLRCAAPYLSIGVGVLLGLALSIWQWLPAYLTVTETTFAANVTETVVPQDYSNLSGAFGLPKRYEFFGAQTPHFFTIGWWTIPAVIAILVIVSGRRRKYAVVIAALFAVFFLLCYLPGYVFPLLPYAFGTTQVTFRLLAFVSLIGAFALCLNPYRLRTPWALAIVALMTATQLGVIYYPMPKFRFTNEQYLKGWEVNAFHPSSSLTEGLFRINQHGGILSTNTILVSRLRSLTGAKRQLMNIRLIGTPLKGMQNFELSVEELLPTKVTYDKEPMTESDFDVTFKLPATSQRIRVAASHYVTAAGLNIFAKLKRVYLIEDPINSYIYSDAIDRIQFHGLRRKFSVRPERMKDFHPTAEGLYVLEIPMVYSDFLVAKQNGAILPHWCDFNYRLNVAVRSLSQPVEIAYRLPWWMWAVTWLALLFFVGLLIWQFRLAIQTRRRLS